jgi:hypothetical protein
VSKLLLKVGEQVELFLVSLVFLVVVLIDLVKELSVICVVVEECSLLPKFGGDGTLKSARDKDVMRPFLPWLHLLLPR